MDLPELPDDLPDFPDEINDKTMNAWVNEVQRIASEAAGRPIDRGQILLTIMLAIASSHGLVSDRDAILRLANIAGMDIQEEVGLELEDAEVLTEEDFEDKRESGEWIDLLDHVREYLERRDMWFARGINYIGLHRDAVLNTRPGVVVATSCLVQGKGWFNMEGLDPIETIAFDNAIRRAVLKRREEIGRGN